MNPCQPHLTYPSAPPCDRQLIEGVNVGRSRSPFQYHDAGLSHPDGPAIASLAARSSVRIKRPEHICPGRRGHSKPKRSGASSGGQGVSSRLRNSNFNQLTSYRPHTTSAASAVWSASMSFAPVIRLPAQSRHVAPLLPGILDRPHAAVGARRFVRWLCFSRAVYDRLAQRPRGFCAVLSRFIGMS